MKAFFSGTLSLFFLLLSVTSIAQTVQDAIRYSQLDFATTARSSGVSGAFSALGADISTASTNPAGIAEFRKSEYAISLSVPTLKTKSTFGNTQNTKDDVSFKLDNLAAVFHYNPRSYNIKTLNLAIGINKLANYNQQFSYNGRTPGTIVSRFLERAEGLIPDELDNFEAGPAFDAGAIYNFDGGTSYQSDFITLNEQNFKTQDVERKGSFNELFFTLASNVNDKVSWGLTLGIPFSEFSETKNYVETDDNNSIDFFDEINLSENLKTSSVGFNLKAGIIYKINRLSRIGLAYHSPSWLYMTDEFNTSVNYSFTSNGQSQTFTGNSPFSEFEYSLRTPSRIIAGIGQLYDLGDVKGFVSGELEYVDYGASKFNLTANSTNPIDQIVQNDLNDQISSELNSGMSFRVGTELAYQKFRLRLGAALDQSPIISKTIYDSGLSYSLGIGFRGDSFYIDAAYRIQNRKIQYSPYFLLDPNSNQIIKNDLNLNKISVTIAAKVF